MEIILTQRSVFSLIAQMCSVNHKSKKQYIVEGHENELQLEARFDIIPMCRGWPWGIDRETTIIKELGSTTVALKGLITLYVGKNGLKTLHHANDVGLVCIPNL